MSYGLLRPLLFTLDPERAHTLSIAALEALGHMPRGLARVARRYTAHDPRLAQDFWGLHFANPVGLAAGYDKDARAAAALPALGFGFIEIGTITPRPQPGNPKPRLFRIPEARAIVNRMGFNNEGVDRLLENVRAARFPKQGGILGINIGKNATTPIEKAAEDYLVCLDKVYGDASYVTVNISSPNTKNLRELQKDEALDDLLSQLKSRQEQLADRHGKYVPMTLKIAPDLDDEQIAAIADALRRHRMDGVIATNTTLSREGVEGLPHADEAGGLSGAPVFRKSTEVLRKLSAALAGELPIIGVGGILSGADAAEKIRAGANLVQFYSGFIYRGPELVGEVAETLANVLAKKR